MPAYSFMKQFVPAVESGLKTHTLRNKRKSPTKPGQMLSLYYAQRSSQCRLIFKTQCTYVHDVQITPRTLRLGTLRVEKLDEFARSDGFKDWKSMVKFWKETHSLPWSGELISWGFRDPLNIFCK